MWEAFIAFLVWLTADPAAIGREHPKAAAAVAAARASLAIDTAPPAPAPTPGKCCGECKGTGVIVHGDGHRTPCPCPSSCKCKGGKGCPDGQCPKSVLR
jgi:hypothetical protein